LKKDRFSVLI